MNTQLILNISSNLVDYSVIAFLVFGLAYAFDFLKLKEFYMLWLAALPGIFSVIKIVVSIVLTGGFFLSSFFTILLSVMFVLLIKNHEDAKPK